MRKCDITDGIMSKVSRESRTEKYNFCKENLILFANDGNWDIFADVENGRCCLYAVALPGSDCHNSWFGDCGHVRDLMRHGYWKNEQLTDAGRELMAAY